MGVSCLECIAAAKAGGRIGCGDENCRDSLSTFRRRVLDKYVLEVVFDVLVSVTSVFTDIASIGMSISKKRWIIAVITSIPVLLPTIVFTNVYLQDETQGYCKLPRDKLKKRQAASANSPSETDEQYSTSAATSTGSDLTSGSGLESAKEQFHSRMDFHCGTCHMLCVSCCSCWGGMLRSICHKDQDVREDGGKAVKKSIKRIFKYVFGTFVLRYISLAWYAKALVFGVRAYRRPKAYIRMALPNTHWSHDLLVKLDFLQAALENAPQCVLQLYMLIVYPDENLVLAGLTLLFSFMDFVRVSVSVQWDIHKGPIIAPSGCYGTLFWKVLNICSWIFLYVGRSAALALVIATAEGWSIAIPVVFLVFHVLIFMKVFSKAKYGVAAQKLFVSVLISLFFLPEFDSNDFPILSQFYYACIHIENLFFIIPWNGIDYDYCFTSFKGKPSPTKEPKLGIIGPTSPTDFQNATTTSTGPSLSAIATPDEGNDCLINSTFIVIAVPALTMVGIILRLAASKKMSDYKKKIPPRTAKMEMEERIAALYSKRWANMTFDRIVKSFLNLLKTEEADRDDNESNNSSGSNPAIFIISPSNGGKLRGSFQTTPNSTRDGESPSARTNRSMSVDASGLMNMNRRKSLWNLFRNGGNSEDMTMTMTASGSDSKREDKFLKPDSELRKRSKSHDDVNPERGQSSFLNDYEISWM